MVKLNGQFVKEYEYEAYWRKRNGEWKLIEEFERSTENINGFDNPEEWQKTYDALCKAIEAMKFDIA